MITMDTGATYPTLLPDLFHTTATELTTHLQALANNDSSARGWLYVHDEYIKNSQAWTCIGQIVGRTTHLTELFITGRCNGLDLLCNGLSDNRTIRDFDLEALDLRDPNQMNCLSPFLASNPSLQEIRIVRCRIGSPSVNILADAISARTQATIHTVILTDNLLHDSDIDRLCHALSGCSNLEYLHLDQNYLECQACRALGTLLQQRGSKLDSVYLERNDLCNESVITLADSLKTNTTLTTLGIGTSTSVSAEGIQAMLDLVCNCSSIKNIIESNHTLCGDLEEDHRTLNKQVEIDIGQDKAHLLRAALQINDGFFNRDIPARPKVVCKIIWCHSRGNINIGDSDICLALMPRVIAWMGDDTSPTTANLIQYHKPPLHKARIDVVRLDSIYRIIRRRAGCIHPSSIPLNQPKKRARRTRRSKKSSKYIHENDAKSNQHTFFYSLYRGMGGGEVDHPPHLFTMHSHAVAWGISRASRDGTLRAANFSQGLHHSISSLKNIFLHYIGIIHLHGDKVQQKPFVSRSIIENTFFSSVNFYALRSDSKSNIKSTYIRIGDDVLSVVLDCFHKKNDFQHSSGSIYGKGLCPSLDTIGVPTSHCPFLRKNYDHMGFLRTDSVAISHKDKNNVYHCNGEPNIFFDNFI